jgi:hypothetical protein
MKPKRIFGKAGVVFIATTVSLILTVGIAAVQYQQAKINKKITAEDLVKAHDGCPCGENAKKVIESTKFDAPPGDDLIAQLDPEFMCSIYSDEEAYQTIVSWAQQGLLGCGMSYDWVFVPDSASNPGPSSTEVMQTQQTPSYQEILFDLPPVIKRDTTPVDQDISTNKQNAGGHWELRVTYVTRTPEEIITELNARRAYWCEGTPIPPGVLDPGDWRPGEAMVFCVGFTLAALQLPARLVNLIALSFGMRICLDMMVYSWISHQLYEAGYEDVTPRLIYEWCYNFLTGGPLP